MKYVHYYETDSEFRQVYNGNEYEEPWVSLTEQNGEVSYNKLMPLYYASTNDLISNFGLSFDYNNDNQFNIQDFWYWRDVSPKPDYLTPDKFNVSEIDDVSHVDELSEYLTGTQLSAGDDGWDMPAQIVRLANDNGQERWCIFNVATYYNQGSMYSCPDYTAIYGEKPELGNIAGGSFSA